jgi:predicted O-methyltransferase YrrM
VEDFARYLLAKRSVDDRALNPRVWERLKRELRESGAESPRIVDVGAGIGTGAERMGEWPLFEPVSAIRYTAVEPRTDLLEEALSRLRSAPFATELVASTLGEFASVRENQGRFDLVVAHALLDVLDLPTALQALVSLARPGGLLYLPITFDGETIFEPPSKDDQAVLTAYHEAMEEQGSSRTGRQLFHALRAHTVDVLEIGGSDWIVHAAEGGYPGDEAFFLRYLLRTIEGAVRHRLQPSILNAWIEERRRQLDSFDLFYSAHQLDVLARKRS